jgi:hypothetical protein
MADRLKSPLIQVKNLLRMALTNNGKFEKWKQKAPE